MGRNRLSWKVNIPPDMQEEPTMKSGEFTECTHLIEEDSSDEEEEIESYQKMGSMCHTPGRTVGPQSMQDDVALALRLQEEENASLLMSLKGQVSSFGKSFTGAGAIQSYPPPREFKQEDQQGEDSLYASQWQDAADQVEEIGSGSVDDEEDWNISSNQTSDNDDDTLSLALARQLEREETSQYESQSPQEHQVDNSMEDESLALAMLLQKEEEEQIREMERQRAKAEEESMKLAKLLQQEEDIRMKDQKLEDKKGSEASAELARRLMKEEREQRAEMEAKGLEAAKLLLREEAQQSGSSVPLEDSDEQALSLEKKEEARLRALQEQARKDLEEAEALAKKLAMEDAIERQRSDDLSLAVAQKMQNEEVFSRPKKDSASKESVREQLHSCQRNALNYVEEQARQEHEAALVELHRRAEAMGYDRYAVDRCLAYIQNDVPIIIHLKENVLKLLTKDTHYRNLFETSYSGGCNNILGRRQWETTLFGAAYEDGCDGSLRPKYGCLNMTGDVRGCERGRYYGLFYITLKKSVRHRCTLFDTDSGGRNETLATCDHYAHVLNRYHDSDLQVLLDVSTSSARRIGGASSSGVATYKEVQIHGDVELAKDVEALSVAGSYSTASDELKETVLKFQDLTGCNVMWQEDMFE